MAYLTLATQMIIVQFGNIPLSLSLYLSVKMQVTPNIAYLRIAYW